MNYTIPYKLSLISRNEGKIKSYESCLDVRAWNHDVGVRSGHLRAWIKDDMPCCFIPVSTIVTALRIMGCRSRGRLTPRCHPNCKSKAVLESICASCQTIKECFKNDPKYEKYFDEEELETSHWPCERCLDALKGIKMLWKIILEKVFRINIPQTEKIPFGICSNNVVNTAKSWKSDMVNEALVVKSILDQTETVDVNKSSNELKSEVTIASRLFLASPVVDISNKASNENDRSENKTEDHGVVPKPSRRPPKVSRSVSVKIKKVDVSCDTSGFGKGDNRITKQSFTNLQQNLNKLMADVERLKKENISLKMELQSVYNENSLETHFCARVKPMPPHDVLACLPKPFDDGATNFVDDVESEMIITMKNCRNTGFKQVSLLQVLHKSHQPFFNNSSSTSCRNEDPIHVLEKLQTTFGAIMQREMGLVRKKFSENPPSDINASYHSHNVNVNVSFSKQGSGANLLSVSECNSSKNVN